MTADHAERVAEIYSRQASGYAECWSPIIRPVALCLLDAMSWASASRALDIGCGTGALLPDIQRRAPSASVIGVDLSAGMLAFPAEVGASVAVMDASNLAVRDQTVDVAVIAFVLLGPPLPKEERSMGWGKILWDVTVTVNLQTAFLSPPVAMSAFYLKGISPPHVTLNQIFNGMYPFLVIQLICLFLTWYWPELTLWLPRYLYGD